jgi:hypothetical protein
MKLSDKIVVVVDYGQFFELGITLSKAFGKVYYFTPWVTEFPTRNPRLPGMGFEEIESIDYLFRTTTEKGKYSFDKVDEFIFPALYCSDWQELLVSMGKRVWGPRSGEKLELDRVFAKKLLKSKGLPVGKYEVVKGIEPLRKLLKANDDLFIKISYWRGAFESWHHKNYKISEHKLIDIEHELGAYKDETEFIIEWPIDSIVEAGIDTYIIDGELPDEVICGLEMKDKSYIAKVFDTDELPMQVTQTKKISDYFKEVQYRGFYSDECRITSKKESYLIDFCTRFGAPPFAVELVLIENLAEIIWFGAVGIMIQPTYKAKYAAEIIGTSSVCAVDTLPVFLPDKYRENIKLRFACKINGTYYRVPQYSKCEEVCDVVGIGNTMDDAVKQARDLCQYIEADQLELKVHSLDDAEEAVEKSRKIGLYF